jgi:HEAT repeat protein
VRLTALDLLEHWNAPVAGIDPWRPETVTAERLAALARWAASPEAAGPATAPALGDRALAEARDLLRRLLAAPDGDVLTLRERLARYGPALLPEIYDALRAAPSDQARDRLTLLRYRVTASEALALQWPVGLERLAAPAAKTRHAALDELAARATAADTGLLLELFSDPDALVRETALRLLQKVGGPSAGDALTRLLKDPDPNVRAAVLKSAAEQPSAAMAARVTEYVATEQDVDLVVHAARVLRNSGAATARKTLYDLLGHASWRVRAEAAEALASGTVAGDKPEQRADFYVRMLDLLADPDGFVASRAMAALERAEGLPDVRKVMLAAQKHPELAAMAVKIMCQNAKSDASALTYVKEFAAHPDAAVRARTIAGLMDAAGEAAAPEVKRALAYPDARVRMAACRGVMDQLDELLPGRYSSSDNKTPYDTFLTNFHAGRGRPRWLNDFRGALEPLLKAQTPAERAAAAAPPDRLGLQGPGAGRAQAGRDGGGRDLVHRGGRAAVARVGRPPGPV